MNFDAAANTPNAAPRIPQTLPQNENAGFSPGVLNYGYSRSTPLLPVSSGVYDVIAALHISLQNNT
jgi:hypothetical protein